MKPNDLVVDQVRQELEQLIRENPDRTGRVLVEDDEFTVSKDYTCVYYTDENNRPVNTSEYWGEDDPVLKTPVCIVGQWIESFHPEFKEDEVIKGFLLTNNTIAAMRYDGEVPFNEEVMTLLSFAQSQQDTGDPWRLIDMGESGY